MIDSFLRITYISIFMFLSLSCKEDAEPDLLPEAFFGISENAKFSLNQDAFIAELADSVQFVNKSVNTTSYEWDFGDGTFSNEKNPFHEFVKPANIIVQLTATNEKGEQATYSRNFEIKKRVLDALAILRIDEYRPDGTRWDDVGNQKLILFLGEIDNPKKRYAFSLGVPPSGGGISTRFEKIELTDKDWFWAIWSNNIPVDVFGDEDEIMFVAVQNPTEMKGTDLEKRAGKFSLNTGEDIAGNITDSYEIQIKWTLDGVV